MESRLQAGIYGFFLGTRGEGKTNALKVSLKNIRTSIPILFLLAVPIPAAVDVQNGTRERILLFIEPDRLVSGNRTT